MNYKRIFLIPEKKTFYQLLKIIGVQICFKLEIILFRINKTTFPKIIISTVSISEYEYIFEIEKAPIIIICFTNSIFFSG